MKKFKVGVIGAGLIAREHSLSLRRNPRVGGLSVYDADPKRASAFAKDFEAIVAASLDELIDGCDVVWVCSPPGVHADGVRRACGAGKAVFCEKPLGMTPADVSVIQKAVRAAGVPFFMGHSNRFNKAFLKMKALADGGEIGDITGVWSTRLGYFDPKVHPAWRLDDKASGGVVVELGVHEIDWTLWIGGGWKTVHAVASSATLNPGKYQDTVCAVGQLGGERIARIDLSAATARYLWQRGIEGAKGSLFFNDIDYNNVVLERPGRKPKAYKLGLAYWKDRETGENFSLRDQADSILRCLESGAPPVIALRAGVEAIGVALAMKESARSGKAIRL